MPVTTTRFDPRLEKGNLAVDTTPVKGAITLNGEFKWGKCPLLGQFPVGEYLVEYGDVNGYIAPRSEGVRLQAGVLTLVSAEYKPGAGEQKLRTEYF